MPIRTQLNLFRSSFQFKLFTVFTLLTAFVSIICCTLYITSEITTTRAHISELLRLQARYLGDSIRLPLYAENIEVLHQLATETIHLPEIRSVVITAKDGRVLTQAKAPGTTKTTAVLSESSEVHSSPLVRHFPETDLNGGDTLLGSVSIVRSTDDLSRLTFNLIVVSCSVAIGFWLAASLLSYLALRKVTGSFNALMHGIDAMQAGDFSSRINITDNDEPGRAAHAINNLASALQLRSEENIRLQEEQLHLERKIAHSHKLESLGAMAGGIAHDYNNLLQSILGNIELASMKLDPGSLAHKYIEKALSSGNQAAHLTKLMLTYAGKGFIDKKEINLNDVVRENSDWLRPTDSSAISTNLCLSDELPAIHADEAYIEQVVMNLIINAREAIEKQPGLIRITTGARECDQAYLNDSLLDEKPAPGQFVFLEISDNGCGMTAETLTRLFDPFFSTKFTGRGLGMSSVLGIIRLHCGALFVRSEPGKGTNFTVLFPVSEPVSAA